MAGIRDAVNALRALAGPLLTSGAGLPPAAGVGLLFLLLLVTALFLVGKARRRCWLLGVDIGNTSIKIVEVRRKRGKTVVTRFASFPTPAGAVKDGKLGAGAEIGRAVRQALRAGGFRAGRAVVALGSQAFIARWVELPALSPRELREALGWEVKQYLPPGYEGEVMDYAFLPAAGTGDGKRPVMVVASPQEVVGAYVKTLREARLRPVAVEIEPLAQLRALAFCGGRQSVEGGEPMAILDLGASGARLSIFLEGTLRLTRQLAGGGRALFLEWGKGGGGTGGPAGPAGGTAWGELLRDIRRSLEYFLAQYQGAVVKRLWLSGGGASLPELGPALELELNLALSSRLGEGNRIKVEVFSVPEGAVATAGGGLREEIGPSYAAALGMALWEARVNW